MLVVDKDAVDAEQTSQLLTRRRIRRADGSERPSWP